MIKVGIVLFAVRGNIYVPSPFIFACFLIVLLFFVTIKALLLLAWQSVTTNNDNLDILFITMIITIVFLLLHY